MPVNSFATTFYISPAGNDTTGDGSIGNPWQTLHKATQTVITAGDIIHVNPGTYVESHECFLAEGVSIEGEGINSILQSSLTADFMAIIVAHSGEGANGNQHISGLKLDGQNLSTFWAICINGRSNVSVYNCTVVDFRDRGVIFAGRSDFTEYPPDSAYATGNKFYNNIVNNCANYLDSNGTYGRGCLNIGGQIGMLIYNNIITQDGRPEGYNGWPIKYINHGYLKNCRIYNNILKKIPYGGTYPGESGWDFCIELFNIEGLEIYGNTIQGSIDLNFSRKGNSPYSAWIHHNNMSRDSLNSKYESGIIFEFGTESVIVEYNIMNNISSGVQFNTRDSSIVTNCVIRKNLFANLATGQTTGTAGGVLFISEGTNNATISNMTIDNNTITATGVHDRQPWVGIDFGSSLTHGSASNIVIRNNIVTGFAAAWLRGSDTTNMDQVVVMSNDAFLNGNFDTPLWPGGEPTNYSYDYFLGRDPMFDSSTNFHLLPISVVIDLGVDVGLPYLGVNPDLGYAEYGGAPPLPINLSDFTGRENGGRNILQWTTASESNSNFFLIERSNNAQSYEAIGRVNAKGFSATASKYNFTDASPKNGKNFYRLAMTDRDGKVKYSTIVSITNSISQTIDIKQMHLSAATQTFTAKIDSEKTQPANIVITDISGRNVFMTGIVLQKGMNSIVKSTPPISKGIYHVRLITVEETKTKKLQGLD
jgi:hypothetical protein